MIKEPTVFILGAGASRPYGFPSGKELRKEICFNFPNQYKIWLARNGLDTSSDPGPYQRAREFSDTFFKSSDPSIDVWLTKNRKFLRIGKTAIIFRILQAENLSGFREKSDIPEQDWYLYLWHRMTNTFVEKDDYKQFAENEINFITFNYDRSLEHFLFESLKNAFYGIGTAGSEKELSKQKFIHVYGKLAPLEWQDSPVNIRYGEEPNQIVPGNFIENLQIIQEAKGNPELEEARLLIQKAKRIFFLGFGYGEENLNLLSIPELLSDHQEIYGTALGFTAREIEKVQRAFLEGIRAKGITGTTRRDIRIENSDCLTLLRTYL